MSSRKRKKTQEVVEEVEEEPHDRIKRHKENYRNKQHTLIMCSRGIGYRYRHLMTDLKDLMPHTKTDVKFDAKNKLYEINEIAVMKNCTNCVFFESRKSHDLYFWMAKTPSGPSAKFHVTNVHTMNELKFTGNCLKGSRPMVSFDKSFDEAPHLRLLKEMFAQVFGTPKMHPKSKPFIDHVLMFGVTGSKVWFRNYQIVEEYMPQNPSAEKQETTLMELGPRFVLELIKIFDGSFGGPVIYENPHFISPNQVRAAARDARSMKYISKVLERERADEHKLTHQPKPDVMDEVFVESAEEEDENEESFEGFEVGSDEEGDFDAEGEDGEDEDEGSMEDDD